MELADVFTDVSTPEVTDSEPEDNEVYIFFANFFIITVKEPS
jgi:hypothetical protein